MLAGGLIAAWLALLSQRVLGALVPLDGAPDARLDGMGALSLICRPTHPAPGHHLPRPPGHEQALCALASGLALSNVVLGTATTPPPRADRLPPD